ncbi:MAG: LamG domain-containing protein [Patescibacteria group bacterium]
MALETNLISSWNLDESSGNATDNKGSNTLTNLNTTTFGAGKINNGGIFNGSTQGFNKTGATIGVANAWTVAGWFKSSTKGAQDKIFGARPASGDANEIRVQIDSETGTVIQAVCMDSAGSFGGKFKSYLSTTNFSANTWYFVSVTWDGTNLKIYLNGSEETIATKLSDGSVTMANSTINMGVGVGGIGTNSFWDGMLDTVNLWSRALSGAEITELYNSGTGMYYNGTIFVTGSVANTTNLPNLLLMGMG